MPTSDGYAGHHTGGPIVLPKIWGADELMATEFPEPRWAIPGILPEGMTILAGKPKMGKSWMALGIGLAIALGGVALGKIEVEKGKVLYLALEDREKRMKRRLTIMMQGQPVPPLLKITHEWPQMGRGCLKFLAHWLEQNRDCRLVIIDTLTKIRRNIEARNQYIEDYRTGENIKKIADDFGICILVIHHLRKEGTIDPLEAVSGTLGLTGSADGTLVVVRERGKPDAVLHVTGRDVDEQELGIKWDPTLAAWSLMGDADTFRESRDRRAIRTTLVEAKGQALTIRDIAQILNKSHGAVKTLLWRMAEDGSIKGVGEGRYTALVTDPLSEECNRRNFVTQEPAVTKGNGKDEPQYAGATSSESYTGYSGHKHTSESALCIECGKAMPEGQLELCSECEFTILRTGE